jgi:hypothetical protein
MLAMKDPTEDEEAEDREDAQEWKTTLKEEITSLLENETWTLIELPEGKNLVSNKWIFKTKLNPDGSVNKKEG